MSVKRFPFFLYGVVSHIQYYVLHFFEKKRYIFYIAILFFFPSRIIVVTPTIIKILDPFAHNAVNGRFVNVPLRSLERIPDILRSRIRNLHRFPLRVVINERTPTVVPTTNGGAYMGQDGTFAAVLAAQMNATPVYHSEWSGYGKITYGYRRTRNGTYGTFAGVIDGWADVSVNGHFLKDYNCYMAELTRHVSVIYVTIVADSFLLIIFFLKIFDNF